MEPERFDVAVVGGGSAGVAAAIAAAECGARTVLIEADEELGGNISQALVHTICGLYLPADAGDARPANPGFPLRFTAELQRVGAAGEPERAGRVWVLPTDPPKLSAAAERMCDATPDLELRLGRRLIAADLTAAGSGTQRLRLRDRSGAEYDLGAALVVDTTGDAAVARIGGADTEMAEHHTLQLPSYIFRLADVDARSLRELAGFERLRVTHAVAHAARERRLPAGCEAVLVRPGFDTGQVFVTLNVPRPVNRSFDPLDPDCVGELSDEARAHAARLVEFLRCTRPAFEKCRVDAWPARIGLRETRRVCGAVPMTGEDVREGRRRKDEVAVSSWPIELWQDHRRARFDLPAAPCSIPLGALVSRSHTRMAVAGRCLGADREALGALRVIGTALASGEAAGVAAALAADGGVTLADVAPERVRQRILERSAATGRVC